MFKELAKIMVHICLVVYIIMLVVFFQKTNGSQNQQYQLVQTKLTISVLILLLLYIFTWTSPYIIMYIGAVSVIRQLSIINQCPNFRFTFDSGLRLISSSQY